MIVQGILEHHDQRITERFFKRSIENNKLKGIEISASPLLID